MSRERFLKAVNLQSVDRVPCNEWIDHPEYVRKLTGIDPFEDPSGAVVEAIRLLDIDWYTGIPKRSHRFEAGETKKDLGHGRYVSEWGFTGSGWEREHGFTSDEEVLGYDPLERSTPEMRVAGYRAVVEGIQADQRRVGDACYVSGLYYTTLFQWVPPHNRAVRRDVV
jgi:hypothetical protein